MPNDIPLDLTMAQLLQNVRDWQDQQTPTLRQTERGVQALQPLIELLIQPEGQSSDPVSRLAELLSATLASLGSLGKELKQVSQNLEASVKWQVAQEEQIKVQGEMLKDLHDALLED